MLPNLVEHQMCFSHIQGQIAPFVILLLAAGGTSRLLAGITTVLLPLMPFKV